MWGFYSRKYRRTEWHLYAEAHSYVGTLLTEILSGFKLTEDVYTWLQKRYPSEVY